MDELYKRLMEHNTKVENAKTYNFFETTGILKRELTICRFIADLLDPEGNHKLGSVGLQTFMELVFEEENDADYYQNFMISVEYPLENGRRMDIVIEGNERFIPIEVKIDAKDQKNQCFDYLEFAKERDSEAQIIYLTKYGAKPSESSMCSDDEYACLNEEDIICISFEETIIEWLERMIQKTGNDLNGLLTQYKQALERMCGVMEQEEKNILTDYILSNEERLYTTLKVSQVIETAKCKLLYKVFEDLERAMDMFIEAPENKIYGLYKEEIENYYIYKNEIDFENGIYGNEPGINYVFGNISLKKRRQVWLRIACKDQFYVGILVIEPDSEALLVSSENRRVLREVANRIDLKNVDYEDDYWLWKFLPNGEIEYTDAVPDFDTMNRATIELANNEKRKIMVEKSMKVIREMLEEIMIEE
ncbi:MAG: PD-(D/E)XK nuclease family protein [Eubacterium sp.]|nr:PD-(D/E)XK nuclease family protein [Eubacterium sp.]